jgi:hypothetical protein
MTLTSNGGFLEARFCPPNPGLEKKQRSCIENDWGGKSPMQSVIDQRRAVSDCKIVPIVLYDIHLSAD